MALFYALLNLVGIIFLLVIALFVFIFIFQFVKVIFTVNWKMKIPFKRKLFHFLIRLLKKRFYGFGEVIKWVIVDAVRGKKKIRLFGIWAFTGYFGEGKTLGAVNYALKIRRDFSKSGQYVHIYTNFNMRYQDGKITKWEDLLNLPPCTIVIFDEIQSTFTSQKFKEFPIELLWKITQCRKQQLCIFASTPVFSRMSIQIRENSDMVITCHNNLKLDRWFTYKIYRAPEYELYYQNPIKLFKHQLRGYTLLASDWDYRAYNTTEIVDRLDITGNEDVKINKNDYSKVYNSIKNEILKLVDEKIKKIS